MSFLDPASPYSGGLWRGRMQSSWIWDPPLPAEAPYVDQSPPAITTNPIPNEWFVPWIDPFSLPINVPVPDPMPKPVKPGVHPKPVENPYRSPNESPQHGQPSSPVRVTIPPYQVRVPTWEIGPGVRTGTGTHDQLPPYNGTKERKQRILATTSGINFVLNGVTEAVDFIDAVYDALPTKYRRWKGSDGKWRDRDITPQDKLVKLYRHINEIDIHKAIVNVHETNAEDYFLGRIGQNVAAANEILGFPAGIATGPAL